MKRKMPKVWLTLAVACMLVIGAVVGSMTMAYAEDTTVLPDDYIAYFTFDGTLADETGSYTATAVGYQISETSKTADNWTYADGTDGQAIVINDTGDLVGLNTGINITSGQSYSISFAVKASTPAFATPIVWIGNTDQSTEGEHWHGFWAGFFDGSEGWTDTDQVGFGSNSSATDRININPSVYLNDATSTSFDWTVITWTFDATDNSVNLYYDGVLVGSASGVTNLTDDAYIYIGANAWDSPAESLTIDELYVYDYVIYEEEDPAITSVEVTELSTDEFTTGDAVDLTGTKIQVTYEDGTSQTLTLGEGYYGAKDSYGNYIEYFLYSYVGTYEEDGETYTDHDTHYYDSRLTSDGAYKVGFYVYDSDWNDQGEFLTDTEVTVNVLSVPASTDVTELTLDETYTAEIEEYGAYVWYSFTPETSGDYTFASSNSEDIDPYVELYVSYDGETLEYVTYDDDYNSRNFYLSEYLDAGTTYYYKAKTFGNSYVGVYDVVIFNNKNITDVSVSTLTQTELTQYVTEFDLTGTEVTVTYSDGTTAVLTVDGSSAVDKYGNYIYYYISVYVEEGNDSWYDRYDGGSTLSVTGDYPVYFCDSYTGIVSDDALIVTVKSIEEADSDEITEIELLDEEVTIEAESEAETWFSFTPVDTSTYYIVSDYTLTTELEDDQEDASYIWYNVYYLDEDGELVWVEPATDEKGNYLYDEDGNELYILTGGVTYYIQLHFEGCYTVYMEEYDEEWWYGDDEMGAYVTVSVQEVGHTHTYADKVVTWTWSDDYTSATAVLRCDTCSHTETATATGTAITSVTTAATATTDGSIVYTATVTINGVEYISDPVTVVIPATGETTPAATDPAATDPAATDPATTDPASTATNTSATPSSTGTAPKTSDVSTLGYYMLLLGAAAVIVVLAKKRVNA